MAVQLENILTKELQQQYKQIRLSVKYGYLMIT